MLGPERRDPKYVETCYINTERLNLEQPWTTTIFCCVSTVQSTRAPSIICLYCYNAYINYFYFLNVFENICAPYITQSCCWDTKFGIELFSQVLRHKVLKTKGSLLSRYTIFAVWFFDKIFYIYKTFVEVTLTVRDIENPAHLLHTKLQKCFNKSMLLVFNAEWNKEI